MRWASDRGSRSPLQSSALSVSVHPAHNPSVLGRRWTVYEKYLGRVKAGLDERCGEEVLAFGLFLPRGSMMMLLSPGASMLQKRKSSKAAGAKKLPRSLAVAVTPTSFCAFGVKDSGYTGKGSLKDEVGRWPRAGTTVEAGGGS